MDEVIIEVLMFWKYDVNHTEAKNRSSCLYNTVKLLKTQNEDYRTKRKSYRKSR